MPVEITASMLEAIEARTDSSDTDRLALIAEVRRLRRCLTRLGSMEAFKIPRAIEPDSPGDVELLARIDFARSTLGIDETS